MKPTTPNLVAIYVMQFELVEPAAPVMPFCLKAVTLRLVAPWGSRATGPHASYSAWGQSHLAHEGSGPREQQGCIVQTFFRSVCVLWLLVSLAKVSPKLSSRDVTLFKRSFKVTLQGQEYREGNKWWPFFLQCSIKRCVEGLRDMEVLLEEDDWELSNHQII